MPRTRRHIFNTLTVLSVAGFIYMSYAVTDYTLMYLEWRKQYVPNSFQDEDMCPPSVAHFAIPIILLVLPAIWLFKWSKRRNLPDNACPSCGYDLTGNETGQCPECGAYTEKLLNKAKT